MSYNYPSLQAGRLVVPDPSSSNSSTPSSSPSSSRGRGGGGGAGEGSRASGQRTPSSTWTLVALERWVAEGLDDQPQGPGGGGGEGEPPPTTFRAAYKVFKVNEERVLLAKERYSERPSLFYEQARSIFSSCFNMVKAAQEMLSLGREDFIKRELDKRLWTNAVYEVTQVIRNEGRSQVEIMFKDKVLPLFLQKMISNFKELMKTTAQLFHLNLSDWPKDTDPTLVNFVYRLYINIGNMYRYSVPPKDFMKFAVENYERARRIDEHNGRAYYQIGVLKAISRKAVSAMYYFERAMMATIPIERAKSDILELHHTAHKKHLLDKEKFWYHLSKYLEIDVKANRRYRSEIWVLPNFIRRTRRIPPQPIPPPNKQQHLASLSNAELFNRFSITLVLAWGKIFSRIGMDEFEQVAEECLVYFEGLVQRNPDKDGGINFFSMIEIVGLTIGCIGLAKQSRATAKTSSLEQLKHNLKLGTLFMLEMFSIAVERLSKLLLLMDWDNEQTTYLSASVMIWCLYLGNNIKSWAISHSRPRFSIRRIEKSRNLNRLDTTDDVWKVFGELLSRIEVILKRGRDYAFPKLSSLDGAHISEIKIPPFKEYIILKGFFPWIKCSYYEETHYMDTYGLEKRAQLLLRLASIHKFGTEVVTNTLKYLKGTREPNIITTKYECNTQLSVPKDNLCGLYERNYWFWIANLERIKQDECPQVQKRNRPDCNGALIMIKKKGSKLAAKTSNRPNAHVLPTTDANKLWCIMDDHQFRSDMVIIARRIVIDTNCFIDKLGCMEKLVRLSPYPILLPVTVILELKGLSKGGLKTREKEHFKDLNDPEAQRRIQKSNEVAENAKDALEFIESNIKYFRVVSNRGFIYKIKSIYNRVQEKSFDPSLRNDNRIMEACVYLELNDKIERQRDTPMRLYRKTILLTSDRGLRVKGITYEIPTIDIESMIFWMNQCYGLNKSSKYPQKRFKQIKFH